MPYYCYHYQYANFQLEINLIIILQKFIFKLQTKIKQF